MYDTTDQWGFPFKLTFSQPVTNFSTDSFALINTDLNSYFTQNAEGSEYTFRVQPKESGPVWIRIEENSTQSRFGVPNNESLVFSFQYNPSFFEVSFLGTVGSGDINEPPASRVKVVDFDVSFTEPAANFTVDNIIFSNARITSFFNPNKTYFNATENRTWVEPDRDRFAGSFIPLSNGLAKALIPAGTVYSRAESVRTTKDSVVVFDFQPCLRCHVSSICTEFPSLMQCENELSSCTKVCADAETKAPTVESGTPTNSPSRIQAPSPNQLTTSCRQECNLKSNQCLSKAGEATCICPENYAGDPEILCMKCPGVVPFNGIEVPCSGVGSCSMPEGGFQAVCECEEGFGGLDCSEDQSIVAPSNVEIKMISFTKVFLSWDRGFSNENVTLIGYRIRYLGQTLDLTFANNYTLDNSSIYIDELVGGTTVTFQVNMVSIKGDGARAEVDIALVPTVFKITRLQPLVSIDGDSDVYVGNTRGGDRLRIEGKQFLPLWTEVNQTDPRLDVFVTVGPGFNPGMFNCKVDTDSVTFDALICTVEEGYGRELYVRLQCQGVFAPLIGTFLYNYSAPVLQPYSLQIPGEEKEDFIGHVLGMFVSGDALILRGRNFGSDPSVVKFQIGSGADSSTCSVKKAEHEKIQCETSFGKGTRLNITVTVGGQRAFSWENTFSYPLVPVIDTIDGCEGRNRLGVIQNCPTQGGLRVLITGDHFGYVLGLVAATIDGYACVGMILTPPTNISCIIPPGVGKTLTVAVTVSGQRTRKSLLSYGPPEVHSITGCKSTDNKGEARDCPRTTETRITIFGINFGASNSTVRIAGTWDVLPGEIVECTDVRHNESNAHSVLTCILPFGRNVAEVYVKQQGGSESTIVFGKVHYDPCLAGTRHNPKANGVNFTCVECEVGRATKLMDQEICEACPQGRSENREGQTECTPCGLNTFAKDRGLVNCLPCPNGTIADTEGRLECQVCGEGYYAFGPICKECPVGASCSGGYITSQANFWVGEFKGFPEKLSYRCQPAFCTTGLIRRPEQASGMSERPNNESYAEPNVPDHSRSYNRQETVGRLSFGVKAQVFPAAFDSSKYLCGQISTPEATEYDPNPGPELGTFTNLTLVNMSWVESWVDCAENGENCTCPSGEVSFGSSWTSNDKIISRWVHQSIGKTILAHQIGGMSVYSNVIECSETSFRRTLRLHGDPAVGRVKRCKCWQPLSCFGGCPLGSIPVNETHCEQGKCNVNREGVMCGTCREGTYLSGKNCAPCTFSHGIFLALLVFGNYIMVFLVYKGSANLKPPHEGVLKIFLFFFQSLMTIMPPEEMKSELATVASFFNFKLMSGEVGGGGQVSGNCYQYSPMLVLYSSLLTPIVSFVQLCLQGIVAFLFFRIQTGTWKGFHTSPYRRGMIALYIQNYYVSLTSALATLDCAQYGPNKHLRINPSIDCTSDSYIEIRNAAVVIICMIFLVQGNFMLNIIKSYRKGYLQDDLMQKVDVWLAMKEYMDQRRAERKALMKKETSLKEQIKKLRLKGKLKGKDYTPKLNKLKQALQKITETRQKGGMFIDDAELEKLRKERELVRIADETQREQRMGVVARKLKKKRRFSLDMFGKSKQAEQEEPEPQEIYTPNAKKLARRLKKTDRGEEVSQSRISVSKKEKKEKKKLERRNSASSKSRRKLSVSKSVAALNVLDDTFAMDDYAIERRKKAEIRRAPWYPRQMPFFRFTLSTVRNYGSLMQSYVPQAFYWEFVLMLRRAAFIIVKMNFESGRNKTSAFAMLCAVQLVLHAMVWPFAGGQEKDPVISKISSYTNFFELTSLVGLAVLTNLSLLSTASMGDHILAAKFGVMLGCIGVLVFPVGAIIFRDNVYRETYKVTLDNLEQQLGDDERLWIKKNQKAMPVFSYEALKDLRCHYQQYANAKSKLMSVKYLPKCFKGFGCKINFLQVPKLVGRGVTHISFNMFVDAVAKYSCPRGLPRSLSLNSIKITTNKHYVDGEEESDVDEEEGPSQSADIAAAAARTMLNLEAQESDFDELDNQGDVEENVLDEARFTKMHETFYEYAVYTNTITGDDVVEALHRIGRLMNDEDFILIDKVKKLTGNRLHFEHFLHIVCVHLGLRRHSDWWLCYGLWKFGTCEDIWSDGARRLMLEEFTTLDIRGLDEIGPDDIELCMGGMSYQPRPMEPLDLIRQGGGGTRMNFEQFSAVIKARMSAYRAHLEEEEADLSVAPRIGANHYPDLFPSSFALSDLGGAKTLSGANSGADTPASVGTPAAAGTQHPDLTNLNNFSGFDSMPGFNGFGFDDDDEFDEDEMKELRNYDNFVP